METSALKLIMVTSRRMSVCLEDTKSSRSGRRILAVTEWSCLCVLVAFWAYFMYEVLRPNKTDHINLFGITFYMGPSFDEISFNVIVYLSTFSCLNVLMMLLSKHSNRARTLCGYNNVDTRQSFQMTVLSAIYFNMILSSSSGLGDFFAVAPISMLVTTVQAGAFYLLSLQIIYCLFWRHTVPLT